MTFLASPNATITNAQTASVYSVHNVSLSRFSHIIFDTISQIKILLRSNLRPNELTNDEYRQNVRKFITAFGKKNRIFR